MSKSTIKLIIRMLFFLLVLHVVRLVSVNTSVTHKDIQAEAVINASASRVWQVLLDFKAYPQWNPSIQNMTGTPSPGEKLTAKMRAGNLIMTLHPTVLIARPERQLCWLGRLFIPWIFDGEHSFIIEPLNENQVRFIQHEEFNGILIPFSTKLLKDTKSSFNEMNRALKERAEQAN
ncbi:SRPBCC domain-containing protein [Methanosarcina sp. DH2]|uniref:SRPBCC domain-containing protein n=1 Tax=Methanosarcina sp. DH2 TaxID=2605639 RepID=UPI001E4524A2|nr:SRPBCC domain-containing protein [Methanosarcina sp. DH2]MCC4771219.1 SRPBCC domain-containing protein [Methanosarcina sp. DH2]